MNWIAQFFRRLTYLLRRKQMDADLAEEMRLHLELRLKERAAESSSPAEAAIVAKKDFGNITRLKEKSRDEWGWGWLDSLAQDLRYGWRNLLRARGFTITAMLSLALGIGANTAIFSIINALMLRLLPVREPQQLTQVRLGNNGSVTNPLWEQIREHQNAFSGMLAFCPMVFDLAEQGEKRPVNSVFVSGDFFKVLGVDPWLGRLFTLDDDLASGGKDGPVAVISHGFWKTHFGSDPNIIGKTIRLDRNPFQIVGVTPPSFGGLDVDSQFSVAIPIGCEPFFHKGSSWLNERSSWWLRIVGRLQPGLTPEVAQTRLESVTPSILQGALPPWGPEEERQFLQNKLTVAPAANGFSGMGREHRSALFATMGVVALVLLIACANIANLLLARAAARRQEISIRLAIGAGRKRLIRQLLTESVLLALLGIPGGLLLAKWGSRLIVSMFSPLRHPIQMDLSLDARVLLFTIGITILTGLLFGLAPAFRATGVPTGEALKQTGRTSVSGSARFNLGKALVASQIALSLALLVAAGLFLGTLRNLLNVPLGFDPKNVLAVSLDTAGRVPNEQRAALFNEVLAQALAAPGVTSAGIIGIPPLSGMGWNGGMFPVGVELKSPDRNPETWFNRVSPKYFQTMHTSLLGGRDFDERDTFTSPKVVIISEKAAREFYGDTNPIGKIISADAGPTGYEPFEIVGVVADTKYREVQESVRRTAFFPLSQASDLWPNATLMVRTESSFDALIPMLRDIITRNHPELSLQFQVLDLQIRHTLRPQRIIAVLSVFFGIIALLLATVGLYGVTSYAVTQRRGEIGIRMALGAQRGSVIWLVLRDVAVILAIGSSIGLAMSFGAGKLIGSLMYDVAPSEPATLIIPTLILAGAGAIAGFLPAFRASKLDPAVALRCE